MKREFIKQITDINRLTDLYNAYKVVCDFYEEYYGDYLTALKESRDYQIMRQARNALYYQIKDLENYGH